MRYLLDTNVFIDYVTDDYVSADIRALISSYENIIYLSSESVKEFIHWLVSLSNHWCRQGKLFPKKIFMRLMYLN